ncbi:hypothetical protein C2S51_028152 [Perilla frutescens var. frutescens]|nr:hypothetical protein C2S51_028152 [Perilla frutescens var. frutescens]
MSTYAALVSLLQILRTMIDSGGARTYNRAELQSIYEKVILLLDFLENSSSTYKEASQISVVERKMREAAYKAEDVIESQKSRILDSSSKRSRFPTNTTSFFICVIGVLIIKIRVRSPEVILDWIKIFFVAVTGILMIVTGVRKFVILSNYLLDTADSRAHETLDFRLVLNDLDVIVKDVIRIEEAQEMSSYAALISLQRTLDSVLDSDGNKHNTAQLQSLHQKVSLLLPFLENASTYFTTQNSADATIRDAVYKAISIIEFQIPAQFNLDLVNACFRRTMELWFHALCAFVSATVFLIAIYKLPLASLPQVMLVMFRLLLGVFIILTIVSVALALVSGRLNVSTEFYNSERQENEELRLIINNLGEIFYKIKDECGNQSSLAPPAASSSSRRDMGGTGKNVVVGLESDLEQIKARLVQDSSKLEYTSIVGMGGIGKTTLARLVYHDPHTVCHFDIFAWVTVSQEYSLRHVLLGLLESAKILTREMQEDDDNQLGVYLHQNLMGRRYLIVMDDVWDTQIWDSISIFFPQNDNGSRVLLTSRLSHVARYPDSRSPIHQMQCLNENNSWSLLREKVFGDQTCPSDLESIGREIAQNCRGLPLAILVIGGLLCKDNQKKIWRDVAENLNSKLRQTEEECAEILGLSYKHLPHYLRPCFLFMGVFLGDSEILASKLISLWAAEGILEPYTSKSLEEVAEDYLNDLIGRNLISVCKRSCNGKIRTCSIHDLLRDVCVQNAQKENFLEVVDWSRHLTRERHGQTPRRLSLYLDAVQDSSTHELISCYYNVRSLLCSASKLLNNPSVVYLGFLYLRVLDVVVVHFTEFPDQILKLIHLRYLAFHYDGSIPPSISKLKNLETLLVHHHKYSLLPRVIWSMPNLRHIYVKPGCDLSNPLGFRLPWKCSNILQHLQTLVGVKNFKWSKGIIKRLPNVKKLVISYHVSSLVDWSAYQIESLVNLHQLETLKITIKYHDIRSAISNVPPKLAFPQKLKKLSLSGCGISWASMTTIGSLPNLEALKLRREACSGPAWQTVEGEFPQLIFLLLEEISLTCWETDAAHFPHLQRLVIRSCGMLEEIPSAIGDIPTLEMIELVDCLPTAVASAKEIQEEQESMGNDDLKNGRVVERIGNGTTGRMLGCGADRQRRKEPEWAQGKAGGRRITSGGHFDANDTKMVTTSQRKALSRAQQKLPTIPAKAEGEVCDRANNKPRVIERRRKGDRVKG